MADKQEPKLICGIVMPISAMDGCSEDHWTEVHEILNEAVDDSGFEPNLVSNADDVGIIQKRIIQNLYDNPIVICDVSGKNPNVMFELGLRLAFDRPTIIVKDDKTSYSFDTSPIEHLEYPRDLRFNKIVEFKITLAEKIKNTYEKASKDPEYTTFLKHFGEFKVAKIDKKEVSSQEFILDELRGLRSAISRLDRNGNVGRPIERARPRTDLCLEGVKTTNLDSLIEQVLEDPAIVGVNLRDVGDHKHMKLTLIEGADPSIPRRIRNQMLASRTKKKQPARKRAVGS